MFPRRDVRIAVSPVGLCRQPSWDVQMSVERSRPPLFFLSQVWPSCEEERSYGLWFYLVDPTSERMLLSRAKPCTRESKWRAFCLTCLRMAH